MQALLKLSRAIDWLSAQVGRWVIWLILGSTIISGVNAVVRKAFNTSSNAYLEVQWYLFAAAFLLAAGYTLLNGEHVKIDVIYGRLSRRAQNWIDIFGFTVFLLPMAAVILWFAVPFFVQGFRSGEMSSNAGGLIRWPVYLMMPVGFALLLLQGVSELIKRVAFAMGPDRGPGAEEGREVGGGGTRRGDPPAGGSRRQGLSGTDGDKQWSSSPRTWPRSCSRASSSSCCSASRWRSASAPAACSSA